MIRPKKVLTHQGYLDGKKDEPAGQYLMTLEVDVSTVFDKLARKAASNKRARTVLCGGAIVIRVTRRGAQ